MARMYSWSAAVLTKQAETDNKAQLASEVPSPDFSISVFAKEVGDEDVEDIKEFLTTAATGELSSRYITFTTRSRIEEAGFSMRKNEPPPCHYDVILGETLRSEDVELLSSVFSVEEKVRLK